MLHEHLKPRGYLEIGVFSGDSLRLVQRGTPAIGIDPDPHLHGHFPGSTSVARTTSDNYFESGPPALEYLDLAFIDGMHLFEFALRDFMNVELYGNRRTVVVLDDVLPRNQHEAARDQCPGDWTGDVWKVPRILQLLRPDLQVILVDTQPTGTCVVFDLDRTSHRVQDMYDQMIAWGLDQWNTVPEEVLSREEAVQPAQALEAIEFYYRGLED
jgi:hypothetical protein